MDTDSVSSHFTSISQRSKRKRFENCTFNLSALAYIPLESSLSKCLRYLDFFNKNKNAELFKFDSVTKPPMQNMGRFHQNHSNNSKDKLNKSQSCISDSESLFDENIDEKHLNKLYSCIVTSTPIADNSNAQSIEIKRVKDIFITYNESKSAITSKSQDNEFFNLEEATQTTFEIKKELVHSKLDRILEGKNENSRSKLVDRLLDILTKHDIELDSTNNDASNVNGYVNFKHGNTIFEEDTAFTKPKKIPKKKNRKEKCKYCTYPRKVKMSRIGRSKSLYKKRNSCVHESKEATNSSGVTILQSELNFRQRRFKNGSKKCNRVDCRDFLDSAIGNSSDGNHTLYDESNVNNTFITPKSLPKEWNRKEKDEYYILARRANMIKRSKSLPEDLNSIVYKGEKENNQNGFKDHLLDICDKYDKEKESRSGNSEDVMNIKDCEDFVDSAIGNEENGGCDSDKGKSNTCANQSRLFRKKRYKKKDEFYTPINKLKTIKRPETFPKENKPKNTHLKKVYSISHKRKRESNVDKENIVRRSSERIRNQIPTVKRTLWDMYVQEYVISEPNENTKKSSKPKRKRFSDERSLQNESDYSKKRRLYCADTWLSQMESSCSSEYAGNQFFKNYFLFTL